MVGDQNLVTGWESVEEVVRVPGGAQPPRTVPPLAMDPGIWLNLVNVKPPYLVDLEIETMKKLFWRINVTLRDIRFNCYVRCSNLCYGRTLKDHV